MRLSPFVWAVALSLPLYAASVFDYGIASKGPLRISGLLLDGVNVSPESNVYIESLNCDTALELRNVRLGGNVKIVNPHASVFLFGGVTSIGGETGQDAIDHHVQLGVPMLMFPYPDTSRFIQYLSGETLTDPYPCGGSYRNIRIPAGTNPTFTGNTVIRGILYIEQPNNVTFGGNIDVTGIIVAAGDPLDNSGANTIDFAGTITGHSITTLDETFDSRLKNEQGTFLIAPGFEVSFGQAFDCLYGCIAANGIRFSGLAGGVIGGNILNYSDELMRIECDSIYLNRSGLTDVPSGFEISTPYTCSASLPMDFNEDCKVDLLDFVVFVEHWLECHREPIEACSQ